MGLTLFQASGSPKWPGQVGSSGRWGKNSTWDGTKGDTLALPSAFRFSDNSMSIRSDVKDLAFGPGGDVLHTQMTPRSLVVEGECIDDLAADLRATERAIKSFAHRPHLKLEFDSGFYVNLAGLKSPVNWKWRKLSGRTYAACRLVWAVADPFWYAANLQTQTGTLSGDGTISVTVNDALANYPVPFTIEFTTGGSEDLSGGITLEQTTDDGMTCTYADPGLQFGAKATLNMERLTCDLDGVSSIRYFGGEFLRLLPGANTLTYTGGACSYKITYRERWT